MFKQKQILVSHESVWLAIEKLLDQHGFDLIRWPEDNETVPTYLYISR